MTTRPMLHIKAQDKYAHIKPLPDPPKKLDGMQESRFIFNARFIISRHFKNRPDVLVNGYGYLCHNTRNRSNWTVPDVIVALGIDPGTIVARNGYVIDEVGKPPEFVLEVASESTGENDYTIKRERYAALGVGEYWRFDDTGGQHHDRSIAGDLLVDGAYEPVEMQTNAEGVTWGRSPLLGLDLCWDKGRLRFYDPVAREYLLDEQETADLAETEASARAVAETRATAAEAEVQRLRDELHRRNTK